MPHGGRLTRGSPSTSAALPALTPVEPDRPRVDRVDHEMRLAPRVAR
jgi:hypothetical protein